MTGEQQPEAPSALRRRLVTIPRTVAAFVVVTPLLPVLALLAVAVDAVRWARRSAGVALFVWGFV